MRGILSHSPSGGSKVYASHGEEIDTESEAETHAVAEIPSEYSPTNPVARLQYARQIGEWLGTCTGWYGDTPYWLVGVETSGQPPFSGEDVTFPNGYEGMYVVFSANSGGIAAFGTLDGTHLTYDSIDSLASETITITHKTPVTLEGAGSGTQPAPITQATIEALPTFEAKCRATEWAP